VIGPDPSSLTTPWVSNHLAANFPVSHGASLGPGGIGYFGDWVDNKLFKFDYNTGAILGAFQADNFVACVPAITASPMVIVSTDNPSAKLFGIDSGIMDYQWFMPTGYVAGSPNIGPEGDVVFATNGGNAYRLNPMNGNPIWTRPGLGTARGPAVFTRDDSKVIVPNGTFVSALNWSDGTVAWNVNYGSTMRHAGVAPNGTIVVGSDSGTIYGLNPSNGAILWTWVALDRVWGAPAFSPDGAVAYVPSYDRRIYALRVADGVRLWSYTTSFGCLAGPSVGFDGRIYVHNIAGDLYCIAPSGALIWQVHLNGESRGPMTIGPDGTLYVGYTGSTSSGLAMIRQQAISLQADSITMERGQILSGGLAQVAASDDTYLMMMRGIMLTASERPVRVIFTTHSPYAPLAQVKITVEAHANVAGLTRFYDLWNFSTGTWEPIGSVSEATSDYSSSVTVSGSQRFADSNGQVKLRVSWKEAGPVAVSKWTLWADYVHFDLVPQFLAP